MTLARVIRRHWHAVQRDVLQLGYRKADMFTRLTVNEMISIVLAAPPGTAVHHAVNGGWTMTDHLLATGFEQQAGLTQLPRRIERPGVTDTRPSRPANVHDHTQPVQRIRFDVMTIDELEKRRRARISKGGLGG